MIRILAVGKMKDKRLSALADDFYKRLRVMAPAEVVELKDSQPEKEARDMVSKLGSQGGSQLVIAMDEHGEDLTSAQLADLLGKTGNICFLIGSSDGLGQEAKERAQRTIRLSSLTMTHEMARVLLLEQIYRGLSILRGKPYHRA
ncbi:MAG: 23S rRNA (pseudouridine1915-N3)-methyltransferase [Candidatus Krumholzibacteriia bacterium]|jgi:23S rRNA (pseudouridine1915-N3)-methyltransferase